MLRVIVEVEGGIVTPRIPPESEGQVEVMVIDYDTEGMDDDWLTNLFDRGRPFVSISNQPIEQQEFDWLWTEATRDWT